MKIFRNLNKKYEQYEVENTDYIIEVCKEPIEKNFVEVWLYKQGYGTKELMFCIEKNNYQEIIENNLTQHIKQYEDSYVDEGDKICLF